eukprot:344469_1
MIQIVSKVVEWYIDIVIISTALLICSILTTITFKSICKSAKSMKVSKIIYAVFISTLLYLFLNLSRVISLPMFNTTAQTQKFICHVTSSMFFMFFGINNLSIDLFLVYRLKTIFKNSLFTLSKCVYYSYIIALTFYWSVWVLLAAFGVSQNHAVPYNVYTESVDTTGNGVTCTVQKPSEMFKSILCLAIIGLFIGNFVIWIIFTRKFYALLKSTHVMYAEGKSCAHIEKSTAPIPIQNSQKDVVRNRVDSSEKHIEEEYVTIMRDQTMLVSLMVFVTCFSFIISMYIRLGQLLITIGEINMLLSIFLSFRFNRYYFHILGCEKLSKCCCMCFVRSIKKRVGMQPEIQLAKHLSKPKLIPKLNLVPSNTNITVNGSGTSIVPELNYQYSADIKDICPPLTPADSECNINLSVINHNISIQHGPYLTPSIINLPVIDANKLTITK